VESGWIDFEINGPGRVLNAVCFIFSFKVSKRETIRVKVLAFCGEAVKIGMLMNFSSND
jgi:hypothetical protein